MSDDDDDDDDDCNMNQTGPGGVDATLNKKSISETFYHCWQYDYWR